MSIIDHVLKLQQKHEYLKKQINAYSSNWVNDTKIKILKKEKLLVKEKIAQLNKCVTS